MPEQVKVEDLEVFRIFRAALLKFSQAAANALSNADGQISRTHSWLENEQMSYWQIQLRKRAEDVTRAREAVRQKKLYKDFSGKARNAAEEEKALARCIAAYEQAQQKIESVRKWIPRLEKAADLYRSGVARLNKTVGDDIPNAVALLDRLALSLEQYFQIEAPAGSGAGAAPAALADASMSRGEETVPAPPPSVQSPAAPADAGAEAATPAPPPSPASQEHRHVDQ